MNRPHMNFTSGQIEQAWKIAVELRRHYALTLQPIWDNLRRSRPLLNAIGIYRLPGDKPYSTTERSHDERSKVLRPP